MRNEDGMDCQIGQFAGDTRGHASHIVAQVAVVAVIILRLSLA